jgi:hypothetical protein
MTFSDEYHGAKQFMMNLSENTYTCGVLQLIHVMFLHTIVVCNLLSQNFYVPPL